MNDLNGAEQVTTIVFILYPVSKFNYTCMSLDKTVSPEMKEIRPDAGNAETIDKL